VAAMEAAHAWFADQATSLRRQIFDASFSAAMNEAFQQPGEVDMFQTHSQFKVFVGPVEPGNRIDAIAERVKAFAKGVASKSIGVEYLEASKRVVVTLGYREDETAYPVSLFIAPLGHIEQLDFGDEGDQNFAGIEQAMSKAAAAVDPNMICHELFITEDGDFLMVILAKTKV
jgi:hypothetical protein